MTIWKTRLSDEEFAAFTRGTMVEHLDIRLEEIGDDFIRASMPVDHRTLQPMGLLHGGASVALAESLGSIASKMTLPAEQQTVGIEINANHIRSVTNGRVFGTARPMHLGRSTHVWEILITDSADKLVCASRLTMAVLQQRAS